MGGRQHDEQDPGGEKDGTVGQDRSGGLFEILYDKVEVENTNIYISENKKLS